MSRRAVYDCDRCGKEMPEFNVATRVNLTGKSPDPAHAACRMTEIDLCSSCTGAVLRLALDSGADQSKIHAFIHSYGSKKLVPKAAEADRP